MSGTFERQIYDTTAYRAQLRQATAPMDYMLNPIRNDVVQPARISDPGFMSRSGVSLTHMRPLVDVESDLLGMDIRNTKDPNQQFQPKCPQCGCATEGYPCGSGLNTGCPNCQERLHHLPKLHFNQNYTLISNPKCTARELGINRFQPLYMQPQDEHRWLHQADVGINYRMVVKDNHVPCVPRLIDQTACLPTGSGDIRAPTLANGVPGTFISPMKRHARARSVIFN
jgi:hypothetical protein